MFPFDDVIIFNQPDMLTSTHNLYRSKSTTYLHIQTWLTIVVWQVSYIQYLLACQKSQQSTPYNVVKCGLPWSRVSRRSHLGRRVTAVSCLRWPTVSHGLPCLLCVCVCLSLCMSACVSFRHELVHAMTQQPFKLGSPNLDQRCKRPWLRSPLGPSRSNWT